MARIFSVHSFRGGTGKSNTTANVATLLAAEGHRVGVIDTDIQSPGIHILFGLAGHEITYTLNDYLWGRAEIRQVAQDITSNLGPDLAGRLFLIPSSIKAGDITRVLREGYDPEVLTRGYRKLVEELQLDVVMIDTHPGLNDETLLSIVISDALAIVMRPDQQDYEGTGVTVQVARKLQVPKMWLIINKVPEVFDAADVKSRVEQTYGCDVAAVMPLTNEMVTLASSGIFALRYPQHRLTTLYRQVAAALMG
jgi:MinD-like ATPase involved in chromosome partitioning or flagellar assembly